MHRLTIPGILFLLAAAPAPRPCPAWAGEAPGAGAKKISVLYIFAHQDDEICIAARMKKDVLDDNTINAVWITNGDKAGDPAERELESRAAMKFLGVPETGLHFLDFEDAFSHKSLVKEYETALALAREINPDVIFSNAYEGGNMDHDIANFVAHLISQALEKKPPHYEFPLYNSYKGTYQVSKFIPRDDTEELSTMLNRDIADAKLGMMKMYPTQNALLVPLSRLVDRKYLKKHGEPYRLVPEYNYLEPPTEGVLGYELNQRRPRSFPEFREAIEEFYASPASPVSAPVAGK